MRMFRGSDEAILHILILNSAGRDENSGNDRYSGLVGGGEGCLSVV
jgi:hypothetical protein